MESTDLRNILRKSSVNASEAELRTYVACLEKIIDNLNRPGVPDRFRDDIMKTAAAGIEMSLTLSAPFFHIDEVLENVTTNMHRVANLLDYAMHSRPRSMGYGVINGSLGKLLPRIFPTRRGAEEYLETFADLGHPIVGLEVIPVELASAHGVAPRTPQQQLTEELTPEVASEDMPRVLNPLASVEIKEGATVEELDALSKINLRVAETTPPPIPSESKETK